MHDRPIANRIDDSVVRSICGTPRLVRRARGYAPAPLALPPGFGRAPPVLAVGGELKNTVCLIRAGEANLSQHIGDLEHPAAYQAHLDTIGLCRRLFDHTPEVLACDCHPEYRSTKHAVAWAAEAGLKLVEVQHHHAHIASCLAENAVPPDSDPVLGVALDGLGYGDDGTLWGGEFLVADYRSSRRVGAFRPVHMPGGVYAIREPWRMAYAYLREHAQGSALRARHRDLPALQALAAKPLQMLDAMIDAGLNSPLTSSCGRLFDAVAALAGIAQEVSYEGQAAMELESAAGSIAAAEGYPFRITRASHDEIALLDSAPLWPALLEDLSDGRPSAVVAARFHAGLARAIVEMVLYLIERHGDRVAHRVALSGGVLQNALLSRTIVERLEAAGCTIYTHAAVPANDGGLALGQAVVAAARSHAVSGG
jgi:hydrogenase maturation protein HypF